MVTSRLNKKDTEILHEYGIDPARRELYLVGESEVGEEPGVEHVMATRFLKNLRSLSASSTDPILVHMKTCGGDEVEGFALYDAIAACPCHVTILSYTHARSMSSIILQAADNRVLMPSSYFMFHRGSMYAEGEVKSVRSYIEFGKMYDRMMFGVYAGRMKEKGKFSKWSLERIKAKLQKDMDSKTDVYLPAQEAVDWGLADSVFDGWDKI